LQEMGDDALMARFTAAAQRLTACRFINWLENDKDMETRNAVIRELRDASREIKRRDMLARLLPLLDSADSWVRFTAAEGCLRIAPEKAVATLEALADDAVAYKSVCGEFGAPALAAGRVRRRPVVRPDFAAQRAAGLDALRRYGALK